MRIYLTGLEMDSGDPNTARIPLRESLQARTVETVYLRAHWLEGKDRFLIELDYRRGVPVSQLAALMGISCNSVRRRLRVLVKRLHNPEYLFCLANREKFTTKERDILRRHLVQGLTIIQATRQCKCSRHMVYRTLEKVKNLMAMRQRLTKPTLRRVLEHKPGGVIRLEPVPEPQREAK